MFHLDARSTKRLPDAEELEKYPVPRTAAAGHTALTLASDIDYSTPSLVNLPLELIDSILAQLSAVDLCHVAGTCQKLYKQASSDFHWLRCVQDNVPGLSPSSPGPCSNFRELYAALDPVWFLPKYKIWFCDRDLIGKIVVVRFDPRRGCIEGYQLLAVNNKDTFEHWPMDNQVLIHEFEPQLKLHLDKPVLQFRARNKQRGVRVCGSDIGRFAAEMPMDLGCHIDAIFSNLILTRQLNPGIARDGLSAGYPYGHVWPPPSIPAKYRVSGSRSEQPLANISADDKPLIRHQVCGKAFRIRQWMEMPGMPSPPSLTGSQTGNFTDLVHPLNRLSHTRHHDSVPGIGAAGAHIGEKLITYSTLDPALYTPTRTKPWRGIWVGDYSGHGCEFLLINQPDDSYVTDAELGLERDDDETDESWDNRRKDARMYRGRLEAIKLTGDPNVPRGEYTFIADDLGPEGYIGLGPQGQLAGARVVRSRGHVAATGFVRGEQ